MSSRNSGFENASGWKKRSSVNKEFKSPLICRVSGHGLPAETTVSESQPSASQSAPGVPSGPHSADNVEKRLKTEVERLREEIQDTEQQICQLRESGIDESELAEYISKLHEYNDLKDIGQMVIGNIANTQGVRTRDLYPNYGLELDD